jgi:hypothetical protein
MSKPPGADFFLGLICGRGGCALGAGAGRPPGAPAGAAKANTVARVGGGGQKQYAGDGIAILPTKDGARLKAVMQDLEGEATREGLWLTSTADEDAGKANRFRVRAMEIGRGREALGEEGVVQLAETGEVRGRVDFASFLRPGLTEEYSVSMDGVRQDFVVLRRPAGRDETLSVTLEVTGARAEAASYGARLTVNATGRELAYSRLKVIAPSSQAQGASSGWLIELSSPSAAPASSKRLKSSPLFSRFNTVGPCVTGSIHDGRRVIPKTL